MIGKLTGHTIPQEAQPIMQKLVDAGFKAYILGGTPRDMLLGKIPHDLDIFTDACGEQILSLFPQGMVIGSEERQKKILTVVVDGIEVSQFRSNGDRTETGTSIEEHCATCDFTINSLFMTLDGEIHDVTGGARDLDAGILKFVGQPDKRIQEDPLRLLRGLRFICAMDLKAEEITAYALCSRRDMLKTLPKERIQAEFMKLLHYDNALSVMQQFGNSSGDYLSDIVPAFESMKGFSGGPHHAETVDQHLLDAFKIACTLTDNTLLRLAAFVHDLGKDQSSQITEGQVTFYDHDTKCAEIVEAWMNDLKFSNDQVEFVTTWITLHLFHYETDISDKKYIEFFNKLQAAGIRPEDYLVLSYCDRMANRKKKRIGFIEYMKTNAIFQKYHELRQRKLPFNLKDLEITGIDVMNILEIQSGSEVGQTLKVIHTLVMDGLLKNSRPDLMLQLRELKRAKDEKKIV